MSKPAESALTPGEISYAEWAEARKRIGETWRPGELYGFLAGFSAAGEACTREACTREVEAAGCRCGLELAQREAASKDYSFAEFFGGKRLAAYQRERDEALATRPHESWCPIALAARLREIGR